jgi:hypothetical protein
METVFLSVSAARGSVFLVECLLNSSVSSTGNKIKKKCHDKNYGK